MGDRITMTPSAVGVGTVDVGERRFPMLKLVSLEHGMEIDVVLGWPEVAALSAELDALRSREAAR